MVTTGRESGKPIDILLVEPSPGNTRLFTEAFKDAQITNHIYTVSDGDFAIDFIHERGEHADSPRPDIVLLDPKRPERAARTSCLR